MTESKMRRLKTVGMSFIFAALLSASANTLLTGCAGKPVDEGDPSALYKDAEEDIKNDHYQLAIDKLRTVRNKFPYSKYSTDAQLRIADVYFLQENFIEAAAAYETFRDLHPKHEKAGYAQFRIAKSYFNDIPSPISRDMTPALKAAEAYQEFLRRYPTAPEADEARKDLEVSRKDLAEKELYVGDFYYKRDFYDSAKTRYQKILELYPETEAATQAKEKLARIAEYEAKHVKKAEDRKESSSDG